jgi:hypothetical protein
MDKQLRSLLNTLIVLAIIYFATRGLVKLFWNTAQESVFNARIKLIFGVVFIGSLIYIVGIYHIVGCYHTAIFYKIYLILAFIYLVLGLLSDTIIKAK